MKHPDRCLVSILLITFILSVSCIALAQDKVNINTATSEQLTALPGIGASIADRIIRYRQHNGGFKSPADIMHVKGIGKAKFEKIKNLITTGE